LVILQSFDITTPEAGIRELSRRLGLDRSTVFRLVRTLVDAGFVEQNRLTQKYRIGPRAFEIGQRYANSGMLYDVAVQEIRKLHEDHGLDVYLAVRLDNAVLYLCAIESTNVVFRAIAGTRGHLHSTSLGKVLLAAEPDETLRDLFARMALVKLTPSTKTSRGALAAEVAKVRRRRYAVSNGENLASVFSVGAPVRDISGKVVAAISVSHPKARISKRRRVDMIEAVTQCAALVSRRLGAPPLIAVAPPSPIVAIPVRSRSKMAPP
jgi:DNA-binding IclR family transcriptional regulator